MKIMQSNRGLFIAATLLAATLLLSSACIPASTGEGLDVGDTSPPFAMTLTDGSQVSLKDIVADNQPSHLFWFATW